MGRHQTGAAGEAGAPPPCRPPETGPAPTTASPWVPEASKLLPETLGRGPSLVAVVREPGHVIEFSNAAFNRAFSHLPHRQEGPGPSRAGTGGYRAEIRRGDVVTMMDEVYSKGELTIKHDISVPLRSTSDPDALEKAYLTIMCMPLDNESGATTVLFVAVDTTERVQAQLDTERGRARLAASERQHRDISLALQHSLLPPARPAADNLDIAVRYLAGTSGIEVGGDWYDVINLGAGRVAVVVGDVMGRGVRAAALMGQLRAAIHSYTRLDLPPAEVLRLLGSLLAELEVETDDDPLKIVTCLYAVYDPSDEELSFANAGHLPPVVVEPSGQAHVIDHEPGPPLGVGPVVGAEETVPMPAGSLLALYTDGLVEQRHRDIDAGIGALLDSLSNREDLETTADRILADLRPSEGYDDDLALLLLRVPRQLPTGPPRRSTLMLPGVHQSAGHVRNHVRRVLGRWGVPADVVETAVLVADEIVINALMHGEPPIRFGLRQSPRRIMIEVADRNPQLPRQRRLDVDAERGRGLHIVAATTSRWGSRVTATGKVVWAEVAFPDNYLDSMRSG